MSKLMTKVIFIKMFKSLNDLKLVSGMMNLKLSNDIQLYGSMYLLYYGPLEVLFIAGPMLLLCILRSKFCVFKVPI